MFWQFIVLVAASLGFPTAALFFLIGGPRFPDEKLGPESRGPESRGPEARGPDQ